MNSGRRCAEIGVCVAEKELKKALCCVRARASESEQRYLSWNDTVKPRNKVEGQNQKEGAVCYAKLRFHDPLHLLKWYPDSVFSPTFAILTTKVRAT